MAEQTWRRFGLPPEAERILGAAPSVVVAESIPQLVAAAAADGLHEVAYDVPGRGRVVEATVARVRNGIAANYTEAYMRRRDPDALVVGDAEPTDKPRFAERFGTPFGPVREETFAWLQSQDLVTFAFYAGEPEITHHGLPTAVIAPARGSTVGA